MSRAQVRPEDLAERYAGRWVIYRKVCKDGTGGDWVASPCHPAKDNLLSAASTERLAELLRRAAAGS